MPAPKMCYYGNKPVMKSALIKQVVSCRLSIVIFTLFTLTLTFAAPVSAQNACVELPPGDNYSKEVIDQLNKCAIQSDIYDDKVFNFNQIAGTTDSLLVLMTGYSQLHPETDELTKNNSALATAGTLVASLYSAPPASGVHYFAKKFEQFNPVQPAYAQGAGIGYDILEPTRKVWSAFRNISYVGFIIVFVITGFMIMFRRRISSQAVATIQDSLPRIVIALILVTFSYALVGFMIDIMFVILNLIINALNTQGLINLNKANEVIFQKNIFQTGFFLWDDIFRNVFFTVADLIEKMVSLGIFGKLIGAIGGSIVGIIAGIAILFILLKLFIMLLFAYVTVVLLTIFAPFVLLFQALPGNNGAKDWFKQVVANLSVFAVVALMFLLAGVLSGIDELGGTGSSQVTRLEQVNQFPLLASGFSQNDISKLIAIGLVLMSPSAAKIVKERFGIREGAVGAGVGAAMAGLGAGAVASRNIGRTGATTFGERTGWGQAISARYGAWKEEPKVKRQVEVGERLKAKGYEVPTYARKTGEEPTK